MRSTLSGLIQVAPGLAGVCVLLLGVGEAFAASGRVPWNCKPEIRYDQATQKNLLYNANCPPNSCTGDDGNPYSCQDWTAPDGPHAGKVGCACPSLTIVHSCILVYHNTGQSQGGYPIVNPACYDQCDGPCPLTSGGGPSPWVVYCSSCSDP